MDIGKKSHKRVRSFSIAVVMAALGMTLGGCASAPGSLLRVPIVSIAMDMEALNRLAKGAADDTISEAAIREMYERPVPPPPGVSFEIGTLRRTIGAMMLGDIVAVRNAGQQLSLHGKTAATIELSKQILMQGELLQGNYRRALDIGIQTEALWAEESRQTGRSAINSSVRLGTLGTMLGVAGDGGDLPTLKRWLSTYPETFPLTATLSEKSLFTYQITRLRAQVAAYDKQGDLNAAAQEIESKAPALAAAYARIAAGSGDHTLDKRSSLVPNELRVFVYGALGRIARASEALAELRAAAANSTHKDTRALYWHAAHLYYMGASDYKNALSAIDENWNSTSSWIRRLSYTKVLHENLAALAALADGNYPEAARRLETLESGPRFEEGIFGRLNALNRSYLSAVDSTKKAVWLAERFEDQAAQQTASDEAAAVFGIKTIVFDAKFRQSSDRQDLSRAVESGRKFSQVLRRIRASGLSRQVRFFSQLQLRQVKHAYLASASAAYSQGSATIDDVLDAISLFQESTEVAPQN